MADQLNVFVENKPGRMSAVTRALSDHNVNIRAVVIQDRGDFGLVKMLVDDPSRGQAALKEAGLVCARKTVLAVVVEDEPGGVYRLLEVLRQAGLNLLDAYGFVVESRKTAVFCVEVPDPAKAQAAAEAAGYRLLSDTELYEL